MPHQQSKTVSFDSLSDDDLIAKNIIHMWHNLDGARQNILSIVNEATRYIEAQRFDYAYELENPESTTLNEFENRTTTPKLAQIDQIYRAKGASILFPEDGAAFLDYRATLNTLGTGAPANAMADKESRLRLKSWLRTKADQSESMRELLLAYEDYIHGNGFVMVEYVDDYTFDEVGNRVQGYRGPKITRILPENIVFNSRATDFKRTPKIIRSVTTVGDILRQARMLPDDETAQEIWAIVKENREKYSSGNEVKPHSQGQALDADLASYMKSGEVEVLTFYGDYYNESTGDVYLNQKIVVVDRCKVAFMGALESWLTFPPIFHAALNKQRNSLYGLGLYYNLLGMQYRQDHLANKNADARDRALEPVTIAINVNLDGLQWGQPNQIFYGEEGGSVEFITPPTEMLLSSIQEQRETLIMMEEMAGAPREIMGIRSPGEKTAFEVQELATNSQELFISRLRDFETQLIAQALLSFQEIGIRNMSGSEAVALRDETGAMVLESVTKDDLTQAGKYVPVGARNYAEKSKVLRTISQLSSQGLFNNPTVMPHISGLRLAKAIETLAGLEPFAIVEENIAIVEQKETQMLTATAQGDNQAAIATPSGIGSDPIVQ